MESGAESTLSTFLQNKKSGEITPLLFQVFGFKKFKEIFVSTFFKAVFFESIYVVILGNKQDIMFGNGGFLYFGKAYFDFGIFGGIVCKFVFGDGNVICIVRGIFF